MAVLPLVAMLPLVSVAVLSSAAPSLHHFQTSLICVISLAGSHNLEGITSIAAQAWVAQRASVHTRIHILPMWVAPVVPVMVAAIAIFAPPMLDAVVTWSGPGRAYLRPPSHMLDRDWMQEVCCASWMASLSQDECGVQAPLKSSVSFHL